MPHANNLDLAVFPAMSKRHSEVVANAGANNMPTCDEIWTAARIVWENMPSATVARGFMHYNRILSKVVEYKGDNAFLQTKEFHTGVRKDFVNTSSGVSKIVK